jgi:hypothetical protein
MIKYVEKLIGAVNQITPNGIVALALLIVLVALIRF